MEEVLPSVDDEAVGGKVRNDEEIVSYCSLS